MAEQVLIQVGFCTDLTPEADVVIAPVSSTGFPYPLPTLYMGPTALSHFGTTLAYGNVADFGLDSKKRRVFGIFVDVASSWEDSDTLSQTLGYGIYNISQKITPATAVVALMSENADPFSEMMNYCLFSSILNYWRPVKFLIPIQNQSSRLLIKALFDKLQYQLQLPPGAISIPLPRAEWEKEIQRSPFACTFCKEYPEDALNLRCCADLLACEICSRYVKQCPRCGSHAVWDENKFTRTKVERLTYVCRCDESMLMSELKTHRTKCPLSVYKCLICNSNDMLSRLEFFQHLKTLHVDYMLRDLPNVVH